MTKVSKISEIKSAGSYEYNGVVINVLEITSSKKLKGICKLQDGTEFPFTNGASNLLYRIEHAGKSKPRTEAGKTSSESFPAKVDNSQAHGTHKVVAVSDNKLARQHRAVMQALATINKVLGYQDSANNLIQAAWFDYSTEQEAIAERLRIEAEAKAKAKAEAEAKAKAEAAAKELQKAVSELQTMVEKFVECGMSYKQAEQLARNNPKYTDEQKEAAFN